MKTDINIYLSYLLLSINIISISENNYKNVLQIRIEIIFIHDADSIINLSSINLEKQTMKAGITLSTTNLPQFDRGVIALLPQQGKTQHQIVNAVGVSKPTICTKLQ